MGLLFYSGKGIQDIRQVSGDGSAGSVDTYMIIYTDNSASKYSVRNGANGLSPRIGDNGHWWVGNEDLGVSSTHPDLTGYSTKAQADFLYKPIGYEPDLSAYSTKSMSDVLYLGINAQASDSAKFGGQLPSYYQPAGSYEAQLTFSTGLNRVGNTIYNTVSQYTDAMADARVAAGIAGKQAQLNGNGLVRMNGTTVTYDYSNYLTGITSAQVLAALGYTPYNAGNPAGYITAASLPASLPASDVYAWAKASSKPSYSWSEIGGRPTNVSQFSNDAGYVTASANRWYDGWVTDPGYDANTIGGSKSGFSYSNNCPWDGSLVHFEAGRYGLQFSAAYSGGNAISFRTRNGDAGQWNSWYNIYHTGNFNPANYLPLTGGALSGSLNITGSNWLNMTTATYSNVAILTGNWTGAGIWGLGSESGHILKFDLVSGQAFQGASDITLKLGTKTVIDTGNIGSQTVNYANSAGNASTVGGYTAGQLLASASGSASFKAIRDGSNYTLTNSDVWLTCTNPSGQMIRLPSTPTLGKFFFLKCQGGSGVYINGNGNSINGANNIFTQTDISSSGYIYMVVWDGAYWQMARFI